MCGIVVSSFFRNLQGQYVEVAEDPDLTSLKAEWMSSFHRENAYAHCPKCKKMYHIEIPHRCARNNVNKTVEKKPHPPTAGKRTSTRCVLHEASVPVCDDFFFTNRTSMAHF